MEGKYMNCYCTILTLLHCTSLAQCRSVSAGVCEFNSRPGHTLNIQLRPHVNSYFATCFARLMQDIGIWKLWEARWIHTACKFSMWLNHYHNRSSLWGHTLKGLFQSSVLPYCSLPSWNIPWRFFPLAQSINHVACNKKASRDYHIFSILEKTWVVLDGY